MRYSICKCWNKEFKFWRIMRGHNAWLGFWYARDNYGWEFALNLFGWTVYPVRQAD